MLYGLSIAQHILPEAGLARPLAVGRLARCWPTGLLFVKIRWSRQQAVYCFRRKPGIHGSKRNPGGG